MSFPEWEGLSVDPLVMRGTSCVKGTRVTVGTQIGLVTPGVSVAEILDPNLYLTKTDIRAAMAHAARPTEERG